MITYKTNIDDLINKLKKVGTDAQTVDYSAALLLGVNASMGEMKFRIFNDGLDADGNTLGKYVGNKKLLFVEILKKLEKIRLHKGLGLPNMKRKD